KPESGAVKMYILWRALNSRQSHVDLFTRGDYVPLAVEGQRADHVIAFVRRWRNQSAITIVPRLVATLSHREPVLPLGESIWKDAALLLPKRYIASCLRNVITGEILQGKSKVRVANILSKSPVAILQTQPRG